MSTKGLAYRLIVLVVMGTCGCARLQRDAVESGETKVQLTSQTGWRDTFQVSKADLAPTGNNPYLTVQPGRVLKLVHGNERLTISILRIGCQSQVLRSGSWPDQRRRV